MMSVEGQLRMMAEMLSAYKNGWGWISAESIKDQEKREEAERALQRTIWRMYKKRKWALHYTWQGYPKSPTARTARMAWIRRDSRDRLLGMREIRKAIKEVL